MTNRTRETTLGNRIILGDSWWLRLRGLLGRPEPAEGEGMLLVPCRGIHMFGMRYPLDVIFLDRRGKVVSTFERLKPGSRTRRQRSAEYALELPAGTISATRTREGDDVVWAPAKDGRVAFRGRPTRPETQGPSADNGSKSVKNQEVLL